MKMRLQHSNLYAYGFCAALLLLSGCGSVNVVVDSEFPEPVVAQLPLHMGVYYSDEFSNFVYREKEEKRGVGLETGASQRKLFETLFKGYFANVTVLNEIPDGAAVAGLDGIIAPEVEELQFATPDVTKSEVYEVWIKYKINLYHADGTPIANWSIPAYGKTPRRFMKSPAEALKQAAVVALRDAGAHFANRFDRLPVVNEWLQTQMAARSEAGPQN